MNKMLVKHCNGMLFECIVLSLPNKTQMKKKKKNNKNKLINEEENTTCIYEIIIKIPD